MARSRRLTSLLIGLALLATALPAAAQERAMVPVTIDGETLKVASITYKPVGGRSDPDLDFPSWLHRQWARFGALSAPYDPRLLARWFTDRGWAVILPSQEWRSQRQHSY